MKCEDNLLLWKCDDRASHPLMACPPSLSNTVKSRLFCKEAILFIWADKSGDNEELDICTSNTEMTTFRSMAMDLL
jgi:hypothetical protein